MYAIVSTNPKGIEDVCFAETEHVAKLAFINAILNGIENMSIYDVNPYENINWDKFFADKNIDKKTFFARIHDGHPLSSSDNDDEIILTEKLASYIINNDLINKFAEFINNYDGWTMSNDTFNVCDQDAEENCIEIGFYTATSEKTCTEEDFK